MPTPTRSASTSPPSPLRSGSAVAWTSSLTIACAAIRPTAHGRGSPARTRAHVGTAKATTCTTLSHGIPVGPGGPGARGA